MPKGAIIHPRRSKREKMLGQVEDQARAVGRSEIPHSPGEVADMVCELLGWSLDSEEADLAVRAYRAERNA